MISGEGDLGPAHAGCQHGWETGPCCSYHGTCPSPKSYIPYPGFTFSPSCLSTTTAPHGLGLEVSFLFLDQAQVQCNEPPWDGCSVPPVQVPTVHSPFCLHSRGNCTKTQNQCCSVAHKMWLLVNAHITFL